MESVAILGLKHILHNNKIGDASMESSEEIISRLKFIGHIQKDEKVDVRRVNVQPNTVLTKFSRAILYPDNRVNTIKFIRDILSRSFEIIEHFLLRNDLLRCKGIVSDLIKAKQGMINLKYTYDGDIKFCCDMDVLIEEVASQLNHLASKVPGIFEEKEAKLN